MGVDPAGSSRVSRLARFGLNTGNTQRLADFYESAFDCRVQSRKRYSATQVDRLMNLPGGAECLTLALGRAVIDVVEFDIPGRACLADLTPYDREFQHFAIVVSDMEQAYERLSQIDGWSAISTAGPQCLPDAVGGVTAFKFRDPDGHPLELLAFARGKAPDHWQSGPDNRIFLGIDHSAISVLDVQRSIGFYKDLGLEEISRTLNHGMEQQLLDGVVNPIVDVIALRTASGIPHVELLGYRSDSRRERQALHINDIAATRLIFETDSLPAATVADGAERLMRDPDGHCVQIEPPIE